MGGADEDLNRIAKGRVRRIEGSRLSRLLISNFPCVAGRIDWRKARDVIEYPAPPSRALGANVVESGFQTSTYASTVSSFLLACLERHRISAEWVAFVGDSMESEYEVELSAVPEVLKAVAEVPDHKYIFGLDGSWCLMWSFEDDLYFGLRR